MIVAAAIAKPPAIWHGMVCVKPDRLCAPHLTEAAAVLLEGTGGADRWRCHRWYVAAPVCSAGTRRLCHDPLSYHACALSACGDLYRVQFRR